MYEVQVDKYKHDISVLTKELQEMQKKYYEMKRKEQLSRQRTPTPTTPTTPQTQQSQS
jgi:hypothetical protein